MIQNEIDFVDFGIENAASFWEKLIVPEFSRVQTEPAGPNVLILSILLWNLSDWMFEERAELFRSKEFTSRDTFKRYLREEACPELRHIWSLCDSTKHRVLYRKRGVEAVKITSGRGGHGGYNLGSGGYGTGLIAYGSGIPEPKLTLRPDENSTPTEVNYVWLSDILEKVRLFYESILFPGKIVRNLLET